MRISVAHVAAISFLLASVAQTSAQGTGGASGTGPTGASGSPEIGGSGAGTSPNANSSPASTSENQSQKTSVPTAKERLFADPLSGNQLGAPATPNSSRATTGVGTAPNGAPIGTPGSGPGSPEQPYDSGASSPQ